MRLHQNICPKCQQAVTISNLLEHYYSCSPKNSIEDEILKNPILAEVQLLLETQTAKGIEKYGKTVNTEEYNLSNWIDHVLQEKVDELVYLVTIKHKIKQVIG